MADRGWEKRSMLDMEIGYGTPARGASAWNPYAQNPPRRLHHTLEGAWQPPDLLGPSRCLPDMEPDASGVTAPCYHFKAGEKVFYDVEFSWAAEGEALHEYLEGTARIALETQAVEGLSTLRGTTGEVAISRFSDKAPAFSRKTRAQVIVSPCGDVMKMKWNGLVIPFRAAYWVSFPSSGVPASGEWTHGVELGLPLLERLRLPITYRLEGRVRDVLHVRMTHATEDADSRIRVQGECTFSAIQGRMLTSTVSIALHGRTDVTTTLRTRLVDDRPPTPVEDSWLFSSC